MAGVDNDGVEGLGVCDVAWSKNGIEDLIEIGLAEVIFPTDGDDGETKNEFHPIHNDLLAPGAELDGDGFFRGNFSFIGEENFSAGCHQGISVELRDPVEGEISPARMSFFLPVEWFGLGEGCGEKQKQEK